MSNKIEACHQKLIQDLKALNLLRLAEIYPQVLDEAARKGSSTLEVLAILIGEEAAARAERALQRRIKAANLPQRKTLEGYDFNFPLQIPKAAILRLFDCDFIARQGNAAFIGGVGTGKTHLLTALGYRACERGYTVRFTRAVQMIDTLVSAQLNGTLEKAFRPFIRPALLLLDSCGAPSYVKLRPKDPAELLNCAFLTPHK